ncbi:hypothetical protein [Enterococcus columbae]|uniref:Uncharacterized protein n=1 Tax=Enterococcus columbae DSM 7374 = ATCC 51263 TaxID=1121865 RepID=S1NER9_9ENTE|nr:hypothetical protein [Enterococcus columbae]EOT42509.1 hypothetical protein OMW_00987 [Enterococcus columbae DSM 7374 = ATCC 51263]EOW87555.1 hypothetical protein I568_00220 [Enterococcus columbae DSM 7374 = ATCC 51263]
MEKHQRIIGQNKIGPYTILYLEKINNNFYGYNSYKIGDKLYKPVVMFDSKNSVAFKTENDDENFVGKMLEYVSC